MYLDSPGLNGWVIPGNIPFIGGLDEVYAYADGNPRTGSKEYRA